jgi:predicted GTPase
MLNDDRQPLNEKFQEELDKQAKKIQRPTILVCGYTGTGKTSLIRAICSNDIVSGKSSVPPDAIGHGSPTTRDYAFYEIEFVRFWDSAGLEAGNREEDFIQHTQQFLRTRQKDPDVANHIHLVWYCIQGCGGRVTETDKNLILKSFPNVANVLVLITKNDITSENQRQSMRQVLVAASVLESRILFCSEGDRESLKAVVRLSRELLPAAFRDAWLQAQLVDLDVKKTKAQAPSACWSGSACH